jgi:2-polyprenyl-6-methoxyphenol hydroxylase-like FAD-dependent oxidoreductase
MIAVPSIETIAIIGAGNGGCAAAAHLAHRGFDIRLYGRSRATTEPCPLSAASNMRARSVRASRRSRSSPTIPAPPWPAPT